MQILRSGLFAVLLVWCGAFGARAESAAEVEVAPVPAPASALATPEAAAAPAPLSPPVAAALPEALRAPDGGPWRVKVIPVREQIGKPVLYVLRRGLKEAQEQKMRAVVIDMDTPGGELGVTLEIMEALDKFDGDTVVYVNTEAISAGAIISSVADQVYFAPGGVIGAAEVVMGTGADVSEGMKRKVNSFMNAKIRAYNEGNSLRGQVIKAMMDPEYEFKIGDKVIKPKGELLSLTAEEAAALHGEPPRPLFSSGTFATLEELLDSKYGQNHYTVSRLEVTWSENLASWLSKISPLLMGAGLLCVFIEFKTPGFGVFGVTGGLLIALVFFGHYVAGLSGYEPALVFLLGVVLVAVEIFVLPGTLVAGISGAALMLGALVWSMADVWPGEVPKLDGDLLLVPLLNVGAAILIAVVGAIALARFLPSGWFWNKMVLQAAVAGDAGAPAAGMAGGGGAFAAGSSFAAGLLGARGRTVSVLRPMGEVEIEGRRHEARAALGSLERDEPVRVTAVSGRVVIVERDAA
jgi:membrane-bound serine protease (ClpP class)